VLVVGLPALAGIPGCTKMAVLEIQGTVIKRALSRMFKTFFGRVVLLDSVQLNLDVLALMLDQVAREIADVNMNVATSTAITIATVPKSERWYLQELYQSGTTGAKQGTRLLIKGKQYSFATSGTGTLITDMSGIILDTGDSVQVYGTNNAADTAIDMWLLYQRLDLEGS